MTKEQFLSGVSFKVKGMTYKGANTYSYNVKDNYMLKQTRSSINDEVVVDDYCCNILKVGKVGFEGFCFVVNKRVTVKYKFEDLVEFKIEEELV
jgi:hypothetical protein